MIDSSSEMCSLVNLFFRTNPRPFLLASGLGAAESTKPSSMEIIGATPESPLGDVLPEPSLGLTLFRQGGFARVAHLLSSSTWKAPTIAARLSRPGATLCDLQRCFS